MPFEHRWRHTSKSCLLLSQALCESLIVDVFPKWVLEIECFVLSCASLAAAHTVCAALRKGF